MANEASVNVSLAISKLGVTSVLRKSYTRDLAGTNQLSNVQTIGTAAELLSIVDLANIAHLCVMNVGDFQVRLTFESAGTQIFAELKPGDICYVPMPAGEWLVRHAHVVAALYVSLETSTELAKGKSGNTRAQVLSNSSQTSIFSKAAQMNGIALSAVSQQVRAWNIVFVSSSSSVEGGTSLTPGGSSPFSCKSAAKNHRESRSQEKSGSPCAVSTKQPYCDGGARRSPMKRQQDLRR